MANVLSSEEKLARFRIFQRRLTSTINLLQQAKQERDQRIREGQTSVDVEATVDAMLAEAQDIAGLVSTGITSLDWAYEALVRIGCPPMYKSLKIDVADGDDAVLTAQDGAGATLINNADDAPFGAYDGLTGSGYHVLLSNCEDPENDGEYELHTSIAATNNILTLSNPMAGGVDNDHDESVEIRLVEIP